MQLLGEYRDEHIPAMVDTFLRVVQLPFQKLGVSARQKNAYTIIEKLRHEPRMSLWRMQDIAGVRVIVSDRMAQDNAVESICEAFPGFRKSDRNQAPHAGYRAIHVIVKPGKRFVEIQVRTNLQNCWAQAFERLGDHWGRQIRHGEPPDQPEQLVDVSGVKISRVEVVEYMRDTVSTEIAEAEYYQHQVADVRRTYSDFCATSEGKSLLHEFQQMEDFADRHMKDAVGLIEALHELPPLTPMNRPALNTQTETQQAGLGLLLYLVGYRRKSGQLVEKHQCADQNEIVQRRKELEERHCQDQDFEIVLLASRSQHDLFRTHARYFEEVSELVATTDLCQSSQATPSTTS